MASGQSKHTDAPAASSPVLEKQVAAAHCFEMLQKQMCTMRARLESDNRPKQQLYAVIATTLLAQDLVQRLLAMQIVLAGEV